MATIIIDSDTTWVEDKDYSGDDILVTNGAVLTIDSWNKTGGAGQITIQCRDFTIDAGAKVSGDGKGYPAGQGPGKGADGDSGNSGYNPGGGAYGGDATNGDGGASGGICYGSIIDPADLGSGSGYENTSGGSGGGSIYIYASRKIEINGMLSVNGENASGGQYTKTGGGSGGSIRIKTVALSGEGSILADGGAGIGGSYYSGSGGGGRISIDAIDYNFAGSVSAYGGVDSSGRKAAPGTVYFAHNNELWCVDVAVPSTYTYTRILENISVGSLNCATGRVLIPSSYTVSCSTVSGSNGECTLDGVLQGQNNTLTIENVTFIVRDGSLANDLSLRLQSNAILTHESNVNSQLYFLDMDLSSIQIDESSSIDVSGKGYTKRNGPGAGEDGDDGNYTGPGGGGYGGKGGNGYGGRSGGLTYGNMGSPFDLGSGSGYESASGGEGGGLVRIIADYILVDGAIKANGADGSGDKYTGSGGGSGGSIWIVSSLIEGNGIIQANGGNGVTNAGGGGGGRIAIYYGKMTSPTFEVNGGTGENNGENGTIVLTPNINVMNWYTIIQQNASVPIQFKFYKCKNWEDIFSHGGDIDMSQQVNDLFGNVSGIEREVGSVSYRKIFFVNDNPLSLSTIKGYISQPTPAPNDEIYLCASGTNDDTVAEASGYTYVHPSSVSDPDAIDWGTLQPGEYKPLWIKRVVQPAAGDGYHNNNFKIKVVKVG